MRVEASESEAFNAMLETLGLGLFEFLGFGCRPASKLPFRT